MIEFVNVSKVYKNTGTHALNNFSLSVDRGEFVFVVGPSGAGKSTFIKLMMREEKPSSGEVFVNGQNLVRMKRRKVPYYRRTLGVVFQDFRLIPNMNVYDNVAFALRVTNVSGKEIRSRVPYILGLVGLSHKAKSLPEHLSGGEQQRVALARALVNNPPLIIADEPTGNIDPALSYEIVDLLSAINERGTTVLMVTHEHSLVKHFHKRIIQIHSGEIVADTAAISKEQQAAAQAVATQETVAVDREAIRRAKEARAKADADAQPYATKEFTAPQNNDQANG